VDDENRTAALLQDLFRDPDEEELILPGLPRRRQGRQVRVLGFRGFENRFCRFAPEQAGFSGHLAQGENLLRHGHGRREVLSCVRQDDGRAERPGQFHSRADHLEGFLLAVQGDEDLVNREGLGRVSRNRRHGSGGRVEHPLRDAAERPLVDAGPEMRGQRDEIGVAATRLRHDLAGGLARHDPLLDRDPPAPCALRRLLEIRGGPGALQAEVLRCRR